MDAHATYKKDLKGIIAVRGPTSFTTLRVVISTLNALAYALDIPILSITKSEFENQNQVLKYIEKLKTKKGFAKPVIPFYNKEPKITKSKNNI